jgi:O-glycosyl hydrolase
MTFRFKGRTPRLATAGAVAFAVALAVAGPSMATQPTPAQNAAAAVSTSVTVDGTKSGRVFDGIGAISGGGGNSRLLRDYPAAQQAQVLDYLFKPGYGADLQMLKLEVGGDANSTDGSEASVEHARGVINCNAGYEFWLAKQAKTRNPGIKLAALSWTAPGWISGGFWSNDTINYLVDYLNCAKSNGLTISYLGGWNERGYNKTWYENLRSTLNAKGYGAVQIVADDKDGGTPAVRWKVADDLVADPAFAKAVNIVGAHYPCQGNGGAYACPTTANALATGKQLWASENGSQDQNTGASALIKSITRGYLDGKMTAYFNWPLIASIYPNLPFHTVGLGTAPEPWSGTYTLGKNLWATAQVTQFTAPGWHFIDSASGYLGGNRANGSYISLKSTNNKDFSTVIETSTATAAQTVSLKIQGGLSTSAVHVWSTSLGSGPEFAKGADLVPSGGAVTLTLQPNMIYTLSTTTGAGKGTATSPAPRALALPYTDNFDGQATGAPATYLADMQGAFEVHPCTGRTGQCVQQMAAVKPIEWQGDSDAFSLFGDTRWANYTVAADTRLAAAGTVELLGRANTQARPQSHQNAYEFRVSNAGAWSITATDSSGALRTLAHGTATALGTGAWHRLSLTFKGTAISAAIDGKQVGSATDSVWTAGQAGIGLVGYQNAQYDNLSVTPETGGPPPATGPIASGLAGKCLVTSGNTSVNGAKVVLGDCTDAAAKQWKATNGALQYAGMCADANQADTLGEPILLWACNGGGNQQFLPQTNGELIGAHSGLCLDVTGSSTANGTPIELWTCTGKPNQQWKLPS